MSSRDPQSQTLAELRSWQAKAEKMVIVAKKDVKTRTELETDLKVNITRLSREADIATRQEKADWDACAHDIIHNPVGNLDEHATVSAKRFHRARLRLETIRHGNEKLLSEATFRKLEAAAQQARAEEEFSRARYEVGLKEISIAMAQASGVAGQVSFQSSPLSGILHHRARCPQCVVTDAYSSTLRPGPLDRTEQSVATPIRGSLAVFVGLGMRCPSFRMPYRWNATASAMSCRVSFSVLPVAMQPGRSGTWALYPVAVFAKTAV